MFRLNRIVSLLTLALILAIAPMSRAEVLATWDERLTGGAGTGGIVPNEWRYYLIGPDGSQLFRDVFLNNSDSGQTYTITEGAAFDAFVTAITDGVNGSIKSRRGPYTTAYPYNLTYDGIVGAIYQGSDYGRDVSEQTLIGSPGSPDLQDATIESISMFAQDIELRNVGPAGNNASYLTGDLTFTINGIPAPEPGAGAILVAGLCLLIRRQLRQA